MKSIKRKPTFLAIATALVVVLSMMTALSPSAAASDSNPDMIDVSPDWLRLSGPPQSLVNTTVVVSNPYSSSVDVSADVPDGLPVEMQHSLHLSPGDNHVPVVVPNMTASYTYGYVTFNWTHNGTDMSMDWLVILMPEAAAVQEVSVDVVNSDISPGDTVMFSFDSLNGGWVSGVGHVAVPETGENYQVDVSFGWASVDLGMDDSGVAVAYFRGNQPEKFKAKTTFNITTEQPPEPGPAGLNISAASPVDLNASKTISVSYNNNPVPEVYVGVSPPSGGTFYKKTGSNGGIQVSYDQVGVWEMSVGYKGENETVSVNVEEGGDGGDGEDGEEEPSVSIDAPGSVTVGSQEWITLTADGDTVPNNPVNIRTPDGAIEQFSTNSMGQLRYTFDKVGDYRLSASYKNASDNIKVSASKASMDVSGPDEAMVNVPVSIDVEEGSSISIDGPEETTTDTASGNTYTFTPAQLGSYTVTAESMTAEASTSFRVYAKPEIRIYDMKGNHVTTAVKGKLYTVSVTHDGESIDTSVEVTLPSGFTENLNNTNTWKPRQTGRYTVTSEKKNNFKSNSIAMQVVGSGGGGIGENLPVIAGIILLVIFIVALWKKDEIQDRWSEWRTEREKPEEPREPQSERKHVE